MLVIVPTHSHHETLGLALNSISRQGYKRFEVSVICDGATSECIDVAKTAAKRDRRIKVHIRLKSRRKGEEYRDEAIRASDCDYVTYLCDDHLFLPDHLETMLREIGDAHFINPAPIFVDSKDEVWSMPTDLSLDSNRQWHLTERLQNSISLSGVFHARDAYLSLGRGWEPTPDDFPWTDLYMWRKFLSNTDISTKTASVSTVIKFLGGEHQSYTEVVSQIKKWALLTESTSGVKQWFELAANAHRVAAAESFVIRTQLSADLEEAQRHLTECLGHKFDSQGEFGDRND